MSSVRRANENSHSADRFAMLESRMSASAHGFGEPGMRQDFSIGFAAHRGNERSNPGLEEDGASAADRSPEERMRTPAGTVTGSPMAAAPDSGSNKRKRPPTPQRATDAEAAVTAGDRAPATNAFVGSTQAQPHAVGMASNALPLRTPSPSGAERLLHASIDSGVATMSPERRPVPRRSVSSGVASAAAVHPASEHGQSIQKFFLPKTSSASTATPSSVAKPSNAPGEASMPPREHSKGLAEELVEERRILSERTRELGEQTQALKQCRAALKAEQETSARLRAELEQAKTEIEAERGLIVGMRAEMDEIRAEQEAEQARQQLGREALRCALRERCFRSRAEARERLARESVRLGRLEPESKAFCAGWIQTDGTAQIALAERERGLELRKAALEDDRKALRKRRASGKAANAVANGNAGSGGLAFASSGQVAIESIGGPPSLTEGVSEACDLADVEESLNFRASLIAKEKAELAAERRQLEREAEEHFHELKLMQELSALDPEFQDCPSLPLNDSVHEPAAPRSNASSKQRFVFLDLIAQGGFAAVFKAYDLQRHEYTACKLHHVSKEWGNVRKEAFVRHVEREIDITVGVNHRRIVETFAVFEINANSFVSVMPYCNGGSLAELLRKHGPLAEKDSKSIMLQILYGLLHLHTRREPIIHYDLKPANILFHDGEVRLSDFGLSKVMAPTGGSQHGMELTSYGSGTHGYLPPECYDGDASRVCPKVDVFSAGVVHYVMLFFPNKPFFKHASQQQILQMKPHTIRQETQQLEFPGKISAEAQAFLRRALAPTREERAGVPELLADPYMQQKGRA